MLFFDFSYFKKCFYINSRSAPSVSFDIKNGEANLLLLLLFFVFDLHLRGAEGHIVFD
jgi:hypothetical protein